MATALGDTVRTGAGSAMLPGLSGRTPGVELAEAAVVHVAIDAALPDSWGTEYTEPTGWGLMICGSWTSCAGAVWPCTRGERRAGPGLAYMFDKATLLGDACLTEAALLGGSATLVLCGSGGDADGARLDAAATEAPTTLGLLVRMLGNETRDAVKAGVD